MKIVLLIVLAWAGMWLGGCQAPKLDTSGLELTFNRGAQLLAAGSPKSAIPFLSQAVASTPDGPEPVALLALAFALDLQSEQALLQAQKVKRAEGEAPGWEAVAVGIAETVRHRPEAAMASFGSVIAKAPAGSPILPATRQWLALSQVIKGDHAGALLTLEELAKAPPMKSTAMLWTLLIRGRNGQTKEAAETLVLCAKDVAAAFGTPSFEGSLDDQTLYDSAVAAIAEGKLGKARGIFMVLQKRDSDGGDTGLWLALISAAEGEWQAARRGLRDACEAGPLAARGLANQLSAVVRAMEDRPEEMIQHMLAGQRMMGREASPLNVIEQPKPEGVWNSDAMK